MRTPIWSVVVSATFAISLTITALVALPETWRVQILISAWSICALTVIGWSVSYYQDRRRLKVSYDPNKLGCIWPTEFRYEDGSAARGTIARLYVESKRKLDIIGCRAVLTYLEKSGIPVIPYNNLKFKFCPAHDPQSDVKTIRYGTPEYLEVLWLPDGTQAEIMTEFDFTTEEHKRLDEKETYLFHVAFSAEGIEPSGVTLTAQFKNSRWKLAIHS